ncbi:hypothetical protein Pst134EA_030474 [Puccinia striiformis f. sp. tritici]|uniref:hypothetical protein n=1 Tax=Puccinia striiformis f. sp. tritici TaxID=168172 RepID=UPI002007B710|nr:hypothetical protein Pst134EA_030474 [Puccinia striiformis f. sp. tritici]KAH9440394.1 hypothetical protein Pst134EB_031010 [Puccinia striiformis f. sp. tritici]KAH9446561.1 hypothetical protein Pst134EA_030474 [Puccinia striiformis f. sp. tritici]
MLKLQLKGTVKTTSVHSSAPTQSGRFSLHYMPCRETQLFDRQLRLLGSLGQKRIDDGSVRISDCCATWRKLPRTYCCLE